MRSSKRINTDVQDEEAALLAEKNDPFTLSFMQFVTMMVNVLKYSNSAYMSFLAIEQHISALSDEERGAMDYTPYFVFLCTLLVGIIVLICMKYRAAQYENLYLSFVEEKKIVLQISSTMFKNVVVLVSILLIGGYGYIAYYHLIYKAYDATRLLLFFVMGTGVFSFLISAKECFGAFNSYQHTQELEVGSHTFQVETFEESHFKLKMSSLGKAQALFMTFFTIGVEAYISYSMIMHIQ